MPASVRACDNKIPSFIFVAYTSHNAECKISKLCMSPKSDDSMAKLMFDILFILHIMCGVSLFCANLLRMDTFKYSEVCNQ